MRAIFDHYAVIKVDQSSAKPGGHTSQDDSEALPGWNKSILSARLRRYDRLELVPLSLSSSHGAFRIQGMALSRPTPFAASAERVSRLASLFSMRLATITAGPKRPDAVEAKWKCDRFLLARLHEGICASPLATIIVL